MGQLVSNIL